MDGGDPKWGPGFSYWNTGMAGAQKIEQTPVPDFDYVSGFNIAIALDSLGRPHIAYQGLLHDADVLMYAYWSGSTWIVRNVVDYGVPAPAGGYHHSIAVDSSNNPHIAYYGSSADAYKYAQWDGSGWEISYIDAYDSVGWENIALALDKNNTPHVAYLCGYYGLKYAYKSGTQWVIQTVESSNSSTGYDCSIAVDKGGNVHISYYDDLNRDLKYAKMEWTSVTTPTAPQNPQASTGNGQVTLTWSALALMVDQLSQII